LTGAAFSAAGARRDVRNVHICARTRAHTHTCTHARTHLPDAPTGKASPISDDNTDSLISDGSGRGLTALGHHAALGGRNGRLAVGAHALRLHLRRREREGGRAEGGREGGSN
jgi:hypothetical protein